MLFMKSLVLAALSAFTAVTARPSPDTGAVKWHRAGAWEGPSPTVKKRSTTYYTGPVITPKVFIISLFGPEAAIWHTTHYNLLAQNLTIPGLSPLYPVLNCNADGSICQVTTGESEINAASTLSAVVLSPYFDLAKTYFLLAGIAGVNPACGTIGGVALARYAVQVGLEYEIAVSELPANLSSRGGYIPLGAKTPDAYPGHIYGTEAFELNAALRNRALKLARTANLTDSAHAQAYRANYPSAPANQPPTVFKGDTETSDVYWHGALLGDAFDEYYLLLTNGSGKYCMTAQEDNAVLEAMIRGAQAGLVDFLRIMIMRAGSNFDRAYPGETEWQNLLYDSSGGFPISLANLYNAGKPIVDDILAKWSKVYEAGIKVNNYAGDILDTVPDGFPPNIGTTSSTEG